MKRDPAIQQAIHDVREVYETWSRRPLVRDCTGRADCCRFRLVGHTPYLTRGEALVAARAWRAAGRKSLDLSADGACPFLDPASARCRIYEGRPFGCRTHFCPAAGGPARRDEVRDLIQRLEEIDLRLGGDGPVSLPVAVGRALREWR
ncbi:YkgJ family cysteine cluster protein [Haloferula sargassicola]|uniref:Zinc/iron-chelating domain-containing protein n=1 Tax=Haloferula sargassicola TaxID=490096 RepID=A0ABP9UKJ8_9BACT